MNEVEEKSEVEFGKGAYFSLNKKITRKLIPDNDYYGLFAVEFIKKGEICWRDIESNLIYPFLTINQKKLKIDMILIFQKVKNCQKKNKNIAFNIPIKLVKIE